ncbi:MAG: Zn-ribbon domain-containing OB-fold protein [Deltaproteobacteria bacterium]|nr:Zn-ribbon domain-containing OB-fold protein [Deltaproteobacteria bacterium]
MAKEEPREFKAEVVVPYELAVGRTWTTFYDTLKEEKILGTKCRKCGRVFVPPRTFCPRCFEEMDEWVEVAQEGVVETWALINMPFYGQQLEIPFVSAQIRLDGSDTGFTHRIGGFDLKDFETVRTRVKLGSRVRTVWSKEKKGGILDIDYFEPVK